VRLSVASLFVVGFEEIGEFLLPFEVFVFEAVVVDCIVHDDPSLVGRLCCWDVEWLRYRLRLLLRFDFAKSIKSCWRFTSSALIGL